MPYIKAADREWLLTHHPTKPGELNYVITEILLQYIGPSPSYTVLNEALGALEAAKLEFYRRAVAPYEDTKIAENGDVYSCR